jgi:shikimate dehydrogenase
MHRAAFAELGLPHTYEAVDCPSEASASAAVGLVRRGGIAGINVTAPWKRAVLGMVDRVDRSASEVSAANTLVRDEGGAVVAYNTDVPALVDEITRLAPRLGTAVIIGAGGAASAALAACQAYGMRVVGVTTRSWSSSEAVYEDEKAEAFRARNALTLPWPSGAPVPGGSKMSSALRLQWLDLAASADLVVQATSVRDPASTELDALIPWDRVSESAVVLDLVYGKSPTAFLSAARRRVTHAEDGLGMLVGQGARALSLWLGVRAPRETMAEAVRRTMTGP